jgi:hypothetical protein
MEKGMPYLTAAPQAYPHELNKKLADTLIGCCHPTLGRDMIKNGKWHFLRKRKMEGEEPKKNTQKQIRIKKPNQDQKNT